MSKPSDARQLLEKHFDTAFAAPDGIKKLRELILTLAMQGKLVPQDANDQPARELLKEIEAEKKRLVKAGKIKAQNPLPEIKPEEVPYSLPPRWTWVRLGDLVYIEMGQSPASYSYNQEGNGLPFFQGKADFGKLHPTPRNWCTQPQKYAYPNDVLLSVRAPVGPTNISNLECCIGRGLAALRPLAGVSAFFINCLIISFRSILESFATGTTFAAVSKSDVENLVIPVPPLAEQRRIVAKVDQLIACCDELEKLRAEHGQKRIAVHTVVLNRLLTATEGETFSATWAFITQNFGELYSVKESVAELRKAILQLAVMGKLVPQNVNDQPARELLKEIEAEKKRLVKEGKIKASAPLLEIKPEEVPYELSKGWEWVRLGSISSKIHYGYTASANHSLKDIRLLRITDIQDNKVDWISVPGCDIKEKDVDQYLLANKDILIARTGGTVGKSYLVKNIDVKAVFASYLIRVVPSAHIDVNYLKYFIEGPLYWEQLYAKCSGTGQPNVNGTSLSTLLLSLPPLAEQRRIVAKIDQLMALCDELEKQIDAATRNQTALLNAVMAQR